jgi:hypothetical protein
MVRKQPTKAAGKMRKAPATGNQGNVSTTSKATARQRSSSAQKPTASSSNSNRNRNKNSTSGSSSGSNSTRNSNSKNPKGGVKKNTQGGNRMAQNQSIKNPAKEEKTDGEDDEDDEQEEEEEDEDEEDEEEEEDDDEMSDHSMAALDLSESNDDTETEHSVRHSFIPLLSFVHFSVRRYDISSYIFFSAFKLFLCHHKNNENTNLRHKLHPKRPHVSRSHMGPKKLDILFCLMDPIQDQKIPAEMYRRIAPQKLE